MFRRGVLSPEQEAIALSLRRNFPVLTSAMPKRLQILLAQLQEQDTRKYPGWPLALNAEPLMEAERPGPGARSADHEPDRAAQSRRARRYRGGSAAGSKNRAADPGHQQAAPR